MTEAEREFLHKLASALAQKYSHEALDHLFSRQDICDAAKAVLAEEEA